MKHMFPGDNLCVCIGAHHLWGWRQVQPSPGQQSQEQKINSSSLAFQNNYFLKFLLDIRVNQIFRIRQKFSHQLFKSKTRGEIQLSCHFFVLDSLKEGLPVACVMNHGDPPAAAFKEIIMLKRERNYLIAHNLGTGLPFVSVMNLQSGDFEFHTSG